MSDVTELNLPCDEWDGPRLPKGYGYHSSPGKRGVVYVHREAWEKVHGLIPEGMLVLHHCDNPPCREVTHLFLGTYSDNNEDASRKERNSKKLTSQDVREIRDAYAWEMISAKNLGQRYGISESMVLHIIHGRSWSWVK